MNLGSIIQNDKEIEGDVTIGGTKMQGNTAYNRFTVDLTLP
jgi:hypothetical protein